MKVRLVEDRPAWADEWNGCRRIPAGTVVEIIGFDEDTGRMIARKGLGHMTVTEDQVEFPGE